MSRSYRLNVFPIDLPPLRERKEGIPMLIEHFVRRAEQRVVRRFSRISRKTLDLCKSYHWPGNIRELQNVVERSVIISSDDMFRVDEAWLSKNSRRVRAREPECEPTKPDSSRERQIIEAALAESRGRVSGPCGAAAKLRIPTSTLDRGSKL